jgi:2-polyprenyl-3-methyl-5-hydroxy-6-metoxy-1,4-benzoquinol methylase
MWQSLLSRKVKYTAFETKDLEEFVRVRLEKPIPTKIQAIEWLANDSKLPERFSLLDVGCGPGVFGKLISNSRIKHRVAYTGVDQSESAIKYAKSKLPMHAFCVRDIAADGIPEGQFDVITIHEVLEHASSGYEQILDSIISRKPKVVAISTFACLPEQKKDHIYWDKKHQCYKNTYSYAQFYDFLRRKVRAPILTADFGSRSYKSFAFPRKADILFYINLTN